MKELFAAAIIILSCRSIANATDSANVVWARSIEEAWRTASEQDRPMMVFVTRSGCLPCARMKAMTFVDPRVAGLINSRFVAVVIDGGQPSALLRDLQVSAVPATFIISPRAVILDRIDGFSSPQQFASRLELAAPRSKPALPQPSATARAF